MPQLKGFSYPFIRNEGNKDTDSMKDLFQIIETEALH